MPVVEIIAIGTELLLGEIQDTNTRYLARTLRDAGVDLYRTMIVGDNPGRITQSIREALSRSDIVITTGGLGPTVDDPTRQAVADSVLVELEYCPELWDQIQDRFRRYGRAPSENNKRQAYVPKGARVIENPVGTAPAFIFETAGKAIISLPGVPHEMEYLLENAVIPYLREHFALVGTIRACVLHTASVGESVIDEMVGDLERQANPTVGLAAHPGQIDIRVTAKASSQDDADRMIRDTVGVIRQRLGDLIFGEDAETLEEVTLKELSTHDLSLVIVETGLGGSLLQHLAGIKGPFVGGEVLPDGSAPEELKSRLAAFRQARQASLALGARLYPNGPRQELFLWLMTSGGSKEEHRSYGGPPQNAPIWAINNSLDFIRKTIASL